MKVVIIGASGMIGSAIRDEALSRGHEVTAVVRHPEKIKVKNPKLKVAPADILKDPLEKIFRGHDAIISSHNPGWGNPNIYDEQLNGGKAIISSAKKAGVKRVLFVGGAASLEVSPGVQLFDSLKLPDAVKGGVMAVREILYTLRKEKDLDWTFLSPAANIAPGKRTGIFRLGKDQLVKNEKGESNISTQDYAVAMIDELEKPKHLRQRFTLAY